MKTCLLISTEHAGVERSNLIHLVHVLYPVPEPGFRILRVIYNETVDPVTIVTEYFDDEVNDL